METLFTLKQIQQILQVDRTTIHRMLKDGRLTGIKVGGQWRFSRQEIESLTQSAMRQNADGWGEHVLPLFCVQRMQDVFAEIAGIGAVVTDFAGQPLTAISNCSPFCQLMQSSPSGKAACQASWREIGLHQEQSDRFLKCHAGLQYARALIVVSGKPVASIISGQFRLEQPQAAEYNAILERLAGEHNLPLETLRATAQQLPMLSEKYQQQIGAWLDKVARTFSDVSEERARLLGRLQQIAAITQEVEGGIQAGPEP